MVNENEKMKFTVLYTVWKRIVKKNIFWFLLSDFNGIVKIKEENGNTRWIKNYENIVSKKS